MKLNFIPDFLDYIRGKVRGGSNVHNYEWIGCDDGYFLDVFNDDSKLSGTFKDRRRASEHRLTIKSFSNNVCGNIKYDTLLQVEKDDYMDGHQTAFFVYLSGGDIKYATEYDLSFAYSMHIVNEFDNGLDLKSRLTTYFNLKEYDTFADFFKNSDLPETYRNAVAGLFE